MWQKKRKHYLFFQEPDGIFRHFALALLYLVDAFASHLSQGLFGLVGGLLGKLGQALPVLSGYPSSKEGEKNTKRKTSVMCGTARFVFCSGLWVNAVIISAAAQGHLKAACVIIELRLQRDLTVLGMFLSCLGPPEPPLHSITKAASPSEASLEHSMESSQHSPKLMDLDWILLGLQLSLQCLKFMLKCSEFPFFCCQSICGKEGKIQLQT